MDRILLSAPGEIPYQSVVVYRELFSFKSLKKKKVTYGPELTFDEFHALINLLRSSSKGWIYSHSEITVEPVNEMTVIKKEGRITKLRREEIHALLTKSRLLKTYKLTDDMIVTETPMDID